MNLVLDTRKTAQQNAQHFFDEAKKLKQKVKGAEQGMKDVQAKIEKLEKQSTLETTKVTRPTPRRSKEWFERFRWCLTRNGLVVVGGKDAHSNEALVKRYLEEKDWYFHADLYGAPHCILREGKTKARREDLEDAASFAGLFSSVWKKGLFSVRVYKVSHEQVSKKAPSGESLGRGAFMIYGQREWFEPRLKLGWGIQETKGGFRIMCGPLACVEEHCFHAMELFPGEKSKTDVAKSYLRYLQRQPRPISISLDELVASLPSGKFSMKPIVS